MQGDRVPVLVRGRTTHQVTQDSGPMETLCGQPIERPLRIQSAHPMWVTCKSCLSFNH